jgi:cysteine desulfurase/selenocysteine lyase
MNDPGLAGLPDVETLTRLANQIFQALPGQSLPTAPPAVGLPGQSLPAAPPSLGLPVQGPQLGRPLPSAPAPDLPTPPPLGGPQLGRPVSGSSSPDVAGLGLDIPGAAELRSLIAAAGAAKSPQPPTSAPAATPSFYFLDAQQQAPTTKGAGYDVNLVRRDFPILKETVNGKPLIWLDNAATTQKPQAVIDRLSAFYAHENSNIHRAAHEMAARATDAYEAARDKVRRFLNAGSVDEIVFLRGTTEAINLVAQSWGRKFIGPGDEIIITWLEHHANIVPWQMLAAEKGAKLLVVPVDDNGQVLLGEYQKLLSSRTKLVSLTQVSNALGTVTPAKTMVDLAHRAGARVLVDGAQSVSHMPTDVQALDCDWFVFSGHKVYGPTGIGALYGKAEVFDESPPWQGGGNMIRDVTFEKTEYQPPPALFEAGTGNIADAVGLGAAIDYVQKIGLAAIGAHEHELLVYGTRLLKEISGLRLIGTAADKAGVLSFVLDGFTTEEVGRALNQEGIAVRSGHHCAQPILRRFGLEATVRPSLGLYNTFADIDALAAAVRKLRSRSPNSIG